MKVINPKSIEGWDSLIVELNKVFDELPEVPEIEFNREVNDILYLESLQMLFESVDRQYTECAIFAESMRSTMSLWKDNEEIRLRDDIVTNHIHEYPNEKDRESKVKQGLQEHTKRLRAARMFGKIIESNKRLLARSEKRLDQIIMIEKKVRY